MRLFLLAPVLALLSGACATWTPVHRSPAWTLYVKDGETIDVDSFDRTLRPAFAAVEGRMGAFERRVRIHAWDGSADLAGQPGGVIETGDDGEMQVAGIGPARVRAFHVRGGSLWFDSGGVFLGIAEVGTAVHELVHARLAENGSRLPLWFEEGFASLLGDGALFEGRWYVDGLACWPLRELRQQKIGDTELAALLALSARDDYDARENLLVHFVGWAIVFDLSREAPQESWSQWLARFERGAAQKGLIAEARERIGRSLAKETQSEWLARLSSDQAGERFAAAKGLWKVRDIAAVDAMLDALAVEPNLEVRVALGLNVLLSTSEIRRMGRSRWNRLSGLVYPTLREATLPDARERAAVSDVYQAMRRWDSRRSRSSQDALQDLARYWEE